MRECPQKDLNLFGIVQKRIHTINTQYNLKCSYTLYWEPNNKYYCSRGVDHLGRVLCVRTFTEIERALGYFDGMLHVLVELEAEKDG